MTKTNTGALRKRVLNSTKALLARNQYCCEIGGSMYALRSAVKRNVKGPRQYTAREVNDTLHTMVEDGTLHADCGWDRENNDLARPKVYVRPAAHGA